MVIVINVVILVIIITVMIVIIVNIYTFIVFCLGDFAYDMDTVRFSFLFHCIVRSLWL